MGLLKNRKWNQVLKNIKDCFSRLNPNVRDAVFKDGETQATTVFLSLMVIRGEGISIEESTTQDIVKILSVYIYNALSLSAGTPRREMISYLRTNYSEYVNDDMRAKCMISFTEMNQRDPEFSAADTKNVQKILDHVKMMDREENSIHESNAQTERKMTAQTKAAVEKEPEGYYFADQEEFLIYVQVEKPQASIKWLSGDNYISAFQAGYRSVEAGNINAAITYLNEAVSWNPVAIQARFELANCYFRQGKLEMALQVLHFMEKYLCRSKDISRYYRSFGYFFIETHDYERAAASYMLSLDYDRTSIAISELSAIIKRYGVDLNNKDIRSIVSSGGAKILEPWFEQGKGNVQKASRQVGEKKFEGREEDEVRCPSCNHILPKDSEFCQYCGTSLKKVEKAEDSQQAETDKEYKQTESINISVVAQAKERASIAEEQKEKEKPSIQENSVEQGLTERTNKTMENSEIPSVPPDTREEKGTSTVVHPGNVSESPKINTLKTAEYAETERGKPTGPLEEGVKINDTPEGNGNDHNNLGIQNKLLFVVIGLLLAIIALLVILLVKPEKGVKPTAEVLPTIAQTDESPAQVSSSAEAKETLIEKEKVETEISLPKAEPKSVEKLDPYGYLNEGKIFGNSINPYIYGMSKGKDYEAEDLSGDGSVTLYTLFPQYEYFSVPEGQTGVDIFDVTDEGIFMIDYGFIVDSKNTDYIKALYIDIIREIEANYGKTYDLGRQIINDDQFEMIDEESFTEEIKNGVVGTYEFDWFFSNYNITLVLHYDPNIDLSRGYVGFVDASK